MLAASLLPPLAPVLLVLAGWWILSSRPKTGRALVLTGAGTLLVLSMPLVGSALVATLERPYVDPLLQHADAIVILGSGSYPDAPEYGHDTVSSGSLERLRYGAFLYRKSAKPILVTGGNPWHYGTPEATQMRSLLEEEWRIPVKWSEDLSHNTFENARNSFAVLNAAGIRRIYLVTHAWHMPRALRVFEAAGFIVIAAPTRFAKLGPPRLADFVPNADGLMQSARFCHEVLGAIWYRLKIALT
jgi:uncharacterized SAM-binding protein YcdF (DUF218 family)